MTLANKRERCGVARSDDPKTPAKQLFGRKTEPTAGPSHVVGFYASGCLAGAEALPINGPLGRSCNHHRRGTLVW